MDGWSYIQLFNVLKSRPPIKEIFIVNPAPAIKGTTIAKHMFCGTVLTMFFGTVLTIFCRNCFDSVLWNCSDYVLWNCSVFVLQELFRLSSLGTVPSMFCRNCSDYVLQELLRLFSVGTFPSDCHQNIFEANNNEKYKS